MDVRTKRATSAAVEDYVKAIFALEQRTAHGVSTNALAERVAVSAPSASAMVRKLEQLGLVTLKPYKGVRLTGTGRQAAAAVLRRHRLLELFLTQELGFAWDAVDDEAELLEHAISDELVERIAERLGDPTLDPHGDPIPNRRLELEETSTVALDALAPGAGGTFVRVSDANPEMLRYLAERGIRPGDRFELVDKQPFGGPITVSFGDRLHVLAGALPRAMRMEVER